MYYLESDIIARENPRWLDSIEKIDQFLYEQQNKAFYAGTSADFLGMKVLDFERVIELYIKKNVIYKEAIWLCLEDKTEMEFISDEELYCPICEKTYEENEAVESILYTANFSKESILAQNIQNKDETNEQLDNNKKRKLAWLHDHSRRQEIIGIIGLIVAVITVIIAVIQLTKENVNNIYIDNITPVQTLVEKSIEAEATDYFLLTETPEILPTHTQSP